MSVSLAFIREGRGCLDSRRQNMLDKVPNSRDWASFDLGRSEMNDLAYLTAKTNHEVAILRGKMEV